MSSSALPVSSGARIRVRVTGTGPPVLLLHGWPQTSVMWHRVEPALAAAHTVVAADLPGYGDSLLPDGAGVAASGKRAMARDLAEAMAALGHDRFAVVGHDRGARCGFRLALDHPDRVVALALLDVLPRVRPEVVHGMCQDYRAGFDVDLADDEADRGRRMIRCPVLVLWGERGPLGAVPDVLDVWRGWARAVDGMPLPTGHHLAEERPDLVAESLLRFLPS